MKWLLSIVFAVLVTGFWVDFAPVYKSLVYAQSLPGEVSASVDEDEGELKASKIKACDNFNYEWTFKINKKGKIKGKVQTTTCGERKVTGTYNKTTGAIALVASLPAATASCCKTFTYTGIFNTTTKIGSGTWVNGSPCTGSGTWSMHACQ